MNINLISKLMYVKFYSRTIDTTHESNGTLKIAKCIYITNTFTKSKVNFDNKVFLRHF